MADSIIGDMTNLSDMSIYKEEKKLNDHERRIDDIEHRPGNWWDSVITGLIAAAALWSLLAK